MPTFWNFNRAIIFFLGSSSVLLFTCPTTSGELIHFTPCQWQNNTFCKFENVAIDPCEEALTNETCIAYRGSNTTISFDFLPKTSAKEIKTQTLSCTLFMEIPDLEHNTDGCQFTSCPIQANQKQRFTYTRYVKEIYPAGTYLVKWKVWTPSNEECCFYVNIKLV